MSMSKSEVWAVVHAERKQLIDDLTSLPFHAWNTASLCPGWTVHDVLAHLVDTACTGRWGFIRSMIAAKGDFDRANADGITRCRHADPEDTLADFRRVHDFTNSPPANRATRLVEAIVHGEDIRRPLSIAATYPSLAVHEALEYQLRTAVSFGGAKERAAGLHLVDTDTDAHWGAGEEVAGRAIDLLMAVSGRAIDPGLLEGAGAKRLTT